MASGFEAQGNQRKWTILIEDVSCQLCPIQLFYFRSEGSSSQEIEFRAMARNVTPSARQKSCGLGSPALGALRSGWGSGQG